MSCFDIGIIQALLDGELSTRESLRVAGHVEVCDKCARLMAAAEEENDEVYSVLARDLDSLVPSHRLWTRINDSIAIEQQRSGFFDRVLQGVRSAFGGYQLAAAASFVIFVGIAFTILIPVEEQSISSPQTVVRSTQEKPSIAPSVEPSSEPETLAPEPRAYVVKESNYSPEKLRKVMATAVYRPASRTPASARYAYADDAYLPGEETYVKAISDLKTNVDVQKDEVFTPATRVPYERDMAVVNDTIQRMRRAVRRNPRDPAARQVLYAAYQDKIDLLNSVSQREELLASLR